MDTRCRRTNQELSLRDIDKRISDLREEAAKIQDVYRKLAGFLHANAILPINEDILEYLRYFLREEQLKQSAGARNSEVIAGLEKTMTEFTDSMELFEETLQEQKASGDTSEIIQSKEIFTLVETLYRLPITGEQIRRQVEGIKIGQEGYGNEHEHSVKLPGKAASSQVMIKLREITSAN